MIIQETTNADGSKTYELVSAEQFADPEVTLSANQTEAHAGETIVLTAEAKHAQADVTYSYEWYQNGQLLKGQEANTLNVTESGSYTVKVTAHKTEGDTVFHSSAVESTAVNCTIGHTFSSEWESDATSHWHACVCGEKGDVQAHTYGEWKITQEATDSAQGKKERTCTVCGYVESAVIPVAGQENPDEPSADEETPATGVASNMAVCLILLVVSAGTAAVMTVLKRKEA